jgi:hypothetical protein
MGKKQQNVVQLFKDLVPRAPFIDTPRRKLARERNFCKRILNCIESLGLFMRNNKWLGEAQYLQLIRAVKTASYSVDSNWYEKIEALEKRERQGKRK